MEKEIERTMKLNNLLKKIIYAISDTIGIDKTSKLLDMLEELEDDLDE